MPARVAIPGRARQDNRCPYLRSQRRGRGEGNARARDAHRNRVQQGRLARQRWPPIHEHSAERRSIPLREHGELCRSLCPWSLREPRRVCRIVSVEWEVPEEYTARSRRVGERVERAGDIDSERQRVRDRELRDEDVEKRRCLVPVRVERVTLRVNDRSCLRTGRQRGE